MREKLLQPMQIVNLTLPNRVVMATVKLGYGTIKGEVTEQHIAFYVRSDDQEAYPFKLW